jgi:hypothetical protein
MASIGPAREAQIEEAERIYSEDAPLRLLYGGSIVVQLGSQLYPSVTAAVAELVSNAWDADAQNAWVTVPFDDDWLGPNSMIEVLDDGVGMTRREAQFKYLVVGRERRREEETDRTRSGRLLHGRKGIGKLAAFGTGRLLEVVTKQEGEPAVAFRLDYDELRKLEPAESAEIEEFDPEPLTDPDGNVLEQGTRVRLTRLQAKRRPSKDRFFLSMRRRFSLDEAQMRVTINGTVLRRFDMEFEYRFPGDGLPGGATVDDGFAVELVDDGAGNQQEVRWWIGFLGEPVKDELLQGISVLVRGKQAQRPFKFERTGGAEYQLAYEYLVGEVHADWIDEGIDEDGDLIASDRDTLQLEDPRLQPFIAWGRRRLRWALVERGRLQAQRRIDKWTAELPELKPMFGRVTSREQQALGRVAERLGRVHGLQETDITDVMQRVLDVREHRATDVIAQEIRALGDAAAETTWRLARDVVLLERRTDKSVAAARLALLDQLVEIAGEQASPPDLSEVLAEHPWLIDMRFDRADSQVLGAAEGIGDAVVLIGPPAWDPDASSTLLAAYWDDEKRPANDDDWLAAVKAHKHAKDSNILLVAQRAVELDPEIATTWDECFARSRRQHEAWHALVRDGDEP